MKNSIKQRNKYGKKYKNPKIKHRNKPCELCFNFHMKYEYCPLYEILQIEYSEELTRDKELSGYHCNTCHTFMPPNHECNKIAASNNKSCPKTRISKLKPYITFFCIDCNTRCEAEHFCKSSIKNDIKYATHICFTSNSLNIFTILLNIESLQEIIDSKINKYDILKTANTLSRNKLHLCCEKCIVLNPPGFLL